jgi:hypothetical protein
MKSERRHAAHYFKHLFAFRHFIGKDLPSLPHALRP